MQPYPVESLRPRNDLGLNASLFKQSGRLQGTLPGTDHDHPLALELAQIVVLACVRSQRSRDFIELGGTGGESGDSSRHHNPSGREFFAVRQHNFEPTWIEIDVADLALLQNWNRLLL